MDAIEEMAMLQFIGLVLIVCGIPLTILTCVPGLIMMGVGALFWIAGKPRPRR